MGFKTQRVIYCPADCGAEYPIKALADCHWGWCGLGQNDRSGSAIPGWAPPCTGLGIGGGTVRRCRYRLPGRAGSSAVSPSTKPCAIAGDLGVDWRAFRTPHVHDFSTAHAYDPSEHIQTSAEGPGHDAARCSAHGEPATRRQLRHCRDREAVRRDILSAAQPTEFDSRRRPIRACEACCHPSSGKR